MEFDFNTYVKKVVKKEEIQKYTEELESIKEKFHKSLPELCWYDMKRYVDNKELKKLISLANDFRCISDVILIIGIGGSSMGAQAMIQALSPYIKKSHPEIIFVGTDLSSEYLIDLQKYLQNKDVTINVISKSGNTMEVLTVFELFHSWMYKKYSDEEVKRRIVVTTSSYDGKLAYYATKYQYQKLNIPSQISGRYSILTPATLFPMALAGFDIVEFLKGAKEGRMMINQAGIYAMLRRIFFEQGKMIEGFAVYEPKLSHFVEWIKQLFAESEGKDKKGIFPMKLIYTRDLHSLGQFIQEGNPIIFETILSVDRTRTFQVEKYNETLSTINHTVEKSVCLAHLEAGCPSLFVKFDGLEEHSLGEAVMFFMISAAMSSYLFHVNPFNHPGVTKYKDIVGEKLKNL
ncbi:MAG: glucose-6-phosphate isomerase [Firmicutes bacterium]|nr:glucose-6-phosphate isomerase [Bacillota bacterium]